MSETDPPKRRGPRIIDAEAAELPPQPGPAEAPPVDTAEVEASAAATALHVAARGGGGRMGLLARLFWAGFAGLFTMALGLWFWEVVESLLARNVWLGRIALTLALLAVFGALGVAVRELAALARIKRIDSVRTDAERARASRDAAAARAVAKAVSNIYRGRTELSAARDDLETRAAEMMDGDAIVDLAERNLMAPLDSAAESAVRRSARDAATATALIPFPLVDVAAALAINLRMIRQIAQIYDGRAGWLGSWRLLKAIAAHLVAAGAIAVGDDFIGPALGGSVLAKVSRRFGEGLLNGALTARIGVAAMEVCRPLPFVARPRPGVTGLIRGALGDVAGRG